MFNFAATESAKELDFVKPGRYPARITKVEIKKGSAGKSDFLDFTFQVVDGPSFRNSFFLSEDALPRLQYLHESWKGKKLDREFSSAQDVADYFSKTFVNSKAPTKDLLVGGRIAADGKVYPELGFSGFILGDDSSIERGEFEEGTTLYTRYVRAAKKTEAAGKGNGILNSNDDEKIGSKATSTPAAATATTSVEEDW